MMYLPGGYSLIFFYTYECFPGGSMVKNPPASAEDTGDMGLIPDLERFPEKEMAIEFNILTWRIPWTEEPGRLQSMGSERVGHN